MNIIARLLALCYEQYYVITRASGNKTFLETISDIIPSLQFASRSLQLLLSSIMTKRFKE